MIRKSVQVLAYSNGKMFQGKEGVIFAGHDRSMFEISSPSTFEDLKQKIRSKLNLEANQEVSKITYRFPISANKYTSVQLKSDDDVTCMFRRHANHSDLNAIELFIEVNTRETRLSQTDAGQLKKMETSVESSVVKVEIHRFAEEQSPLRDGSNNGLHSAERTGTTQKGVLRGGTLRGVTFRGRSSTRQMKGRGS